MPAPWLESRMPMSGRFPPVHATNRLQDTPPNQDGLPSPSQRTNAGVSQASEGPPALRATGRSQPGTASSTSPVARAKARPIDLLDAPTRELIRSTVSAVSTLSGLDAVLDAINGPMDLASTHALGRLSSAARLALLQGLAERLPDVPDHPDPYRSLGRSAILHAAAGLPAPYKGGLVSLETGRMFETAERAVQCGVPIAKAATTFGITDQEEIQRLEWVAEYAAKGHIYAGCSVSETAALHGIGDERVLVALQPASVETAAGAAVVAGAMTVDQAAGAFGITDRDEIDMLNWYAEAQPTEFVRGSLARAEYLSVWSPHVTVSLQSGEDVRDLARRLELADPFARRLLHRRAAEVCQLGSLSRPSPAHELTHPAAVRPPPASPPPPGAALPR